MVPSGACVKMATDTPLRAICQSLSSIAYSNTDTGKNRSLCIPPSSNSMKGREHHVVVTLYKVTNT